MPDVRAKRELGRGERVLPGLFRLRLPLPWPGVPHCNAWAVACGDGFVLFDTGMHDADSLSHLERALDMCDLRLEQARLVVCTHRSLRAGRHDRAARRMRGVDAPQPRAPEPHDRRSRLGGRAPH
jgi:hypothetical protein